MKNSTYNPISIQDFDKTKLNFNAQGTTAVCVAGQSTNIDFALNDDMLLTGAWLIANGGNYGDTATMQVIDTAGAFTGVAGTVLNQFMTNWYIPQTASEQFDIQYPAKILAGMTLRVIYKSTGTSSPFVAINYKMHMVLI